MLNSPGNHGHWMGLSVGATNLAGTRDGRTAVIRPAELTRRGQRLTGFVDRVGDPVPLVAPDGATYRSEDLLADALSTLANAARDFSQFGETVRFADFSGDQIDQALLTHVVAGLADVDPTGTAMVG